MSIVNEDKQVYKGQHKDYTIFVAGSTGMLNITGSTLAFNVKETVSGDPIIEKTSADDTEIKITDGSNGEAELYLLPTDTSSLGVGKYYYEIWITDLNSKTRPILTGYFWVMEVAPSLIDEIRDLLGDGGELRVEKIPDEMLYPADLSTVYVTRQRVTEVEGIWLFTDTEHSGTNYYTGGGFDTNSGRIWLGTPLLSTTQAIRVNYTWESGLSDDAVYRHLYSARLFTINFTGIEFTYGNASNNEEKGAEAMSIAGAIIGSILTINGANVAQMGYNFRLDEFEVQTKLWGEGMIAESLFKIYTDEYQKWIQALGKAGIVHVVNRTTATAKYNIERLVGFINTSGEGAEN